VTYRTLEPITDVRIVHEVFDQCDDCKRIFDAKTLDENRRCPGCAWEALTDAPHREGIDPIGWPDIMTAIHEIDEFEAQGRSDVLGLMIAYGFQLVETGGGCTAFTRELSDGSRLMISEGAEAPTHPDDHVWLIHYGDDGEHLQRGRRCLSVTEAGRWSEMFGGMKPMPSTENDVWGLSVRQLSHDQLAEVVDNIRQALWSIGGNVWAPGLNWEASTLDKVGEALEAVYMKPWYAIAPNEKGARR
jgi:hypothetical protein